MKRLLFALPVCGVLFSLAVPLPGEELKPLKSEASSATEERRVVDPAVPQLTTERVAVQRIEYVDVVENGVTTKRPVVRTAYEDRPVIVYAAAPLPIPTNESEIETLRTELKALRERKIDTLDVATLVREVHREREAARADEAWKKLQKIRKELADLELEHPGTPAASLAKTAQQIIPTEPSSMFGTMVPGYPVQPTPAMGPLPSTARGPAPGPVPGEETFSPAPSSKRGL